MFQGGRFSMTNTFTQTQQQQGKQRCHGCGGK
jgi:hypothetical protein